MLSSALFDLDGLLVDTEIITLRIYRDLVGQYGHDMSRATYAERYSGHIDKDNMRSIIERYRLPITMEEGLTFVFQSEAAYLHEGVDLKPGARELLSWLSEHGFAIALASASAPERAHMLLAQHGIDHFFSAYAFSSEVEQGKPAPDVFLLAAKRLQASPGDCVVFEDSEAGVRAGHAGGMAVVCVPDMHHPAPEVARLANLVTDTLDQAIPFIEQAISHP